jgi:hypothetical protein
MSSRRDGNWAIPLLIVGLLTITVLGAAQIPGLRPCDFLLRRWQADLDQISESELETRFRQISQLGTPGWQVLVRSLGHPRSAVAEAAARVLHHELEAWQSIPSKESSPRIALLVHELADNVDSFGGIGRRAAGEFATRALRWPLDSREVDQPRVIADCDRILRVAVVLDPNPENEPETGEEFDSETVSTPRSAVQDDETNESLGAFFGVAARPIPGGGLPAQPIEMPSLPPSLVNPDARGEGMGGPSENQESASLPSHAPREIFPETATETPGISSDTTLESDLPRLPRELPPTRSDEPGRLDGHLREHLPESGRPSVVEPPAQIPPPLLMKPAKSSSGLEQRPELISPAVVVQLQGAGPVDNDANSLRSATTRAGNRMEQIPDLQVVRMLADRLPERRQLATEELRRRGFEDEDLLLARQFISPDVDKRRALVTSLADISVSPTRWLLWLSQDENAEIRRLAVTFMAKTRDRLLHRRLDEMVATERDPSVIRELQRCLVQRHHWTRSKPTPRR